MRADMSSEELSVQWSKVNKMRHGHLSITPCVHLGEKVLCFVNGEQNPSEDVEILGVMENGDVIARPVGSSKCYHLTGVVWED